MGIGPCAGPVPPPAVSSAPIRAATCCIVGAKLASQIDDEIPLAPKALTHWLMRMLGSAKLESAAVHECATTGHGHEDAPQDVSAVDGAFHCTV